MPRQRRWLQLRAGQDRPPANLVGDPVHHDSNSIEARREGVLAGGKDGKHMRLGGWIEEPPVLRRDALQGVDVGGRG